MDYTLLMIIIILCMFFIFTPVLFVVFLILSILRFKKAKTQNVSRTPAVVYAVMSLCCGVFSAAETAMIAWLSSGVNFM